MTPTVLVLCTGNLCRSPLVGALLHQSLAAAGVDAVVRSAGVAAPDGATPDRKLLRAAGEVGVDLSEHRSRQVTPEELAGADLIVALAWEHAEWVARVAPGAEGRTVLLRPAAWRAAALAGRDLDFGEWVQRLSGNPGPGDDVADPIGGPYREYRAMAAEVSALVQSLVKHWPGR